MKFFRSLCVVEMNGLFKFTHDPDQAIHTPFFFEGYFLSYKEKVW